MSGSATLVRSLLGHGLVDELRLLVHPLVVGSGAKLFENGMASVPLELVASRTFATGVLDLTYSPVAAA
jgi:dihydrofolate reductase